MALLAGECLLLNLLPKTSVCPLKWCLGQRFWPVAAARSSSWAEQHVVAPVPSSPVPANKPLPWMQLGRKAVKAVATAGLTSNIKGLTHPCQPGVSNNCRASSFHPGACSFFNPVLYTLFSRLPLLSWSLLLALGF